MKTWQQQRAAFVLERLDRTLASHAGDQHGKWRLTLRQLSRSLPMMVRVSSLGQAVAELQAKSSGSAEQEVLDWMKDWLSRDGGPFAKSDPLLDACMQCDQSRYLAAQAEAMALLAWVKLLVGARVPALQGARAKDGDKDAD